MRPELVTRLNVGCGLDIRPEYVNADLVKMDGVDVEMDVTKKWPFPDGLFQEVFASHVIEHLPQLNKEGKDCFIHFLEEAHRVLKPGGFVHLKYPAPSLPAKIYYQNPTHYRRIPVEAYRAFLGFKGTCVSWWTKARFKSIKVRWGRALILRRIGPVNGFHITHWHWGKYLGWTGIGRKYEARIWLYK